MEIANSNDDCYFYYYSSCTKGDDCPYRHCLAALGTETVCTAWREGQCYRSNCKFRHMESRIDRSSIPCYWENQPSGCRKPHCVFLHKKDRFRISSSTEEKKLILPLSSQPHSPNAADVVSDCSKNETVDCHSLSPSQRIQPVVVSLDEGEESDSESVASTPMKAPTLEIRNSKFSKRLFCASKTSDLGIKTLEQIRMERIHRESEHFYNTDKLDGSDLDENSELKRLDKLHSESNSFYSTTDYNTLSNEVTAESREAELYQNASLYPLEMNNILHDNNEGDLPPEEKIPDTNCSSMDDSPRDLRNVLKKRRRGDFQGSSHQDLPKTRIISLKKTSNIAGGESSPAVTVTFEKESKELGFSDVSSAKKKEPNAKGALNFRIKTLDEIRKEKEKKIDIPEQVSSPEYPAETFEQTYNWEGEQCDLGDESKENSLSNGLRANPPKRKLKRKPIEVYKVPQKVAKIDSLAVEDINFSQTAKVVEDRNNETTDGKALALPIMTVEPNKNHRIKVSVKRALPNENAPTKFKKISAGSIIKHNSFETKAITEKCVIEEFSKESKAAEGKLFKLKKSSPSSKRPLLHRRNVYPAKINSSDADSGKTVRNVCEIPEEMHNQVSNGSEHKSSSSKSISSSPDDLSIDTNKSSPQLTQSEDAFVDNSDSDLFTLSSPVATLKQERSLTFSSVDDIDKLFSGCDTDLSPEEVDCTLDKDSDDIFLELEKMIQS